MYRTFNTAGHHVVGFCTIFSQRTTSVYTFGEVCLCTLYSEYEIHSWYVLLLLVCWNMIHAAISKLWSEFHALICDPTSVSQRYDHRCLTYRFESVETRKDGEKPRPARYTCIRRCKFSNQARPVLFTLCHLSEIQVTVNLPAFITF